MKIIFNEAAKVDSFANFTETILNTAVGFEMVAIPAGKFTIFCSVIPLGLL